MASTFKLDIKKSILDNLKKEGMPPIIDKTYNSIWDTFAKSQPSALTTSTDKGDSDIWGNLSKNLEKFGVQPNIAKKVVAAMQKKYGESPSQADIKAMMT